MRKVNGVVQYAGRRPALQREHYGHRIHCGFTVRSARRRAVREPVKAKRDLLAPWQEALPHARTAYTGIGTDTESKETHWTAKTR